MGCRVFERHTLDIFAGSFALLESQTGGEVLYRRRWEMGELFAIDSVPAVEEVLCCVQRLLGGRMKSGWLLV